MKLKIGIGVVVVVLAVVAIVLLTGGGDDDGGSKSPKDEPSKAEHKPGSDSKSDDDADASAGDEPALRTVAVKRAKGTDASVAVSSPLIRKPGKIFLRASAAPKQKVRVNWTLACGVGATAGSFYEATPPDTRQLELPKKHPKICIASASTQIDGNGRVKLSILRDR
jgi:hypothetical protein